MNNISQKALKLIKNLNLSSVLFLLFISILPMKINAAEKINYQLLNPKNMKVSLRLALSRAEHEKGLSGTKASEFTNTEAMLFVNEAMGPRRFWMPDTYFNLDIMFLDQNLVIVGIEPNTPFHPGKQEPPEIYRTKTYQAQFVLETKTGSAFSKNLKVGDKLKWVGKTTLSEIVLKTHHVL